MTSFSLSRPRSLRRPSLASFRREPARRTFVVEIYHVFPADSNVGRTSGPPAFSTPNVPTRVNSPSDVEFVSRDLASGSLSFIQELASRCDLNPNTVMQWRKRVFLYDAPMGPKVPRSTVLSAEEEALAVPRTEAHVIRHSQERMPYGLFVPDVIAGK
jgi:hypothetical protein